MSRASPWQTSFNGGELSPRVGGRVDQERYHIGCSVLENFKVAVQGPIVRRGGTHYVDPVLDEDYSSVFMRFVFSYDQAFLIEFNNNRLGFFTDRGRLLAVRTVTGAADNGGGLVRITSASHGFLDGQEVTIADVGGVPGANSTFTIDYINANSFDLLGSTFSGLYTLGGTATGVYMIATQYVDADLVNDDGGSNLSYWNSADVVYITGGGKPAQKLSRLGNTNWTLSAYDPDDGPYMEPNPPTNDTQTVYASAATGAITLTASSSLFLATHVGALIRLEVQDLSKVLPWEADKDASLNDLRRSDGKTYKSVTTGTKTTGSVRPTHTKGKAFDGSDDNVEWEFQDPGYGVARITSYSSGTSVGATVLKQMPAGVLTASNPTWRWQFGAWGAHNEYPRKVSKWRERLVFGGTRLWLSIVADFDKHSPDEEGQQTFESAIDIQLGTAESEVVRWLAPLDALIAGTASAECAVVPQTDADPVGPANIKAPQRSAWGGRDLPSARIGESVAFADKSGHRLREVSYSDETGVYASRDLNVFADHIFDSPVVDLAFQASPDPILWSVRADGVLPGLTYEKEQECFAWHRHLIAEGVVEECETLPSPDGTKEDLWLVVRRTIDGETRRYVEWMDHGLQRTDSPADAFYVDSGLSYDGAPASVAIEEVTIPLVDPNKAVPPIHKRIVETTAAHRLITGDRITIAGVDGSGDYAVNGEHVVTVVDATHLRLDGNVYRVPTGAYTSGGAFMAASALATTLTGLDHLEGMEVAILGDGAVQPNKIVTGGAITLSRAVTRARVGLPFISRMRTMRPDAGGDFGTAQGKTKRLDHVVFRFFRTLGGKYGPTFDVMDEFQSEGTPQMDAPPPLFTGDKRVLWPGGYETDGYMCVQQDQPLPMELVACGPDLETAST